MRSVSCLVLAALLAPGCEQDTDIQGHIELGDLVRLDLPADEAVGSIGLIDDWVLILSYRVVVSPPPEWAPSAVDLYVRWLSPENVLSEPIYAGRALGSYRSPRWVRDGDALTGPLWATWDPSGPPGDARTYIRMASYRPGETVAACEVTPTLPVALDPEQAPLIWWNNWPAWVGPEGYEPAAVGAGPRAYAAIHADDCAAPLARTGTTSLAVGGATCGDTVSRLVWAADHCWPRAPGDAIATLWTMELSGDDVGVLYRSNDSAAATLFVRLSAGLEPSLPMTVGRVPHDTGGFGHQPRGAAAGDRVLFTERDEHQQFCSLLRHMTAEGLDPQDAGWQLPCWRERREQFFIDEPVRLHPYLDLHSSGEAATLVYVDMPNGRLMAPSPSPTAIRAVTLTATGRRATPVVELAPPDAEAIPFVRSANDGLGVAAAFADEAPGREGYWLRRFAYVPDTR